jgi:hypothetical protein
LKAASISEPKATTWPAAVTPAPAPLTRRQIVQTASLLGISGVTQADVGKTEKTVKL